MLLLCAFPAHAQDRFELSLGLWRPTADIVLSNDGNGIKGTPIDLRQDAGLMDRTFGDVSLLFRLARRHAVRFEYLPMSYDSAGTLARDVVFTGVTYARGTAVTSNFEWESYRAGYQYAFIARPHWTWELVAELRQTIITERLAGGGNSQARESHVPVPMLGLAVRAAVRPRFAMSGEITGFGVPDNEKKTFGGHIVDANVAATFAMAPHVSAQAGYRLIDIGHLGDSDTATLTLKGFFAGGLLTW